MVMSEWGGEMMTKEETEELAQMLRELEEIKADVEKWGDGCYFETYAERAVILLKYIRFLEAKAGGGQVTNG